MKLALVTEHVCSLRFSGERHICSQSSEKEQVHVFKESSKANELALGRAYRITNNVKGKNHGKAFV